MIKKPHGVRGSLLVAALLVFCLLAVLCPATAHAADASWSLSITSVETKDALHTTKYTTKYDGSVEVETYEDEPSAGKCYAIVTLSAEPLDASGEGIDLTQLQLSAAGGTYAVTTPMSFLSRHDYSVFSADTVYSSSKGAVAFEVDEALLDSDGEGWSVSCGSVTSDAYAPLKDQIEWQSNTVDSQLAAEESLLSRYEAAGRATLSDPFIARDVYGAAPLTAVALFETDDEVSVSVTVHGKNGDSSGDISYPVEGESTHHEVPIFGLYAGYANQVTITAGSESQTITITTDALPDTIETVTKVAGGGRRL